MRFAAFEVLDVRGEDQFTREALFVAEQEPEAESGPDWMVRGIAAGILLIAAVTGVLIFYVAR